MSKNAFKTTAFRAFVYEVGRRLFIGMATRTTKWSIKKFNEDPAKTLPKHDAKKNLFEFEPRDFSALPYNTPPCDEVDSTGSSSDFTHLFEPSE